MKYSILKNKWFLYITEFFAGLAIMAVELGASRLLAPYFSSSQIVWTIIIGTIMIAMALGNLYGGKSSDKDPDPAKLYRRILIAAVWIGLIPVLGKYVILGVSALLIFTVSTNYLVIASFASCMILFVCPLFLLGTVTPSLVKAAVDSLDDSGSIVGRLGACNTVGSILGTFLPTFVTIPAVGTSVTFLIFAGILLVVALIFFISAGSGRKAIVIGAVLFAVSLVFGRSNSFAFWEADLLYEGESVYNYLQIREDEREVILSTNVLFGVQSVMMKDDGLTGMYYDYALAAPAMAEEQEAPEILVLGNGTGTYAKQCLRYYPLCSVEGVEIDAAITDLAARYFAMPGNVKVTEYDGRAFLQAVDKTYDVILVDAYQDITIPFQMSSVEFFDLVKARLNPGGIMAVNLNMHSRAENSISSWLCDTVSAVFPYVSVMDVPLSTNRMLFASEKARPAQLLEEGLQKLPEGELKALLQHTQRELTPYSSGGKCLTDEKAPVELLGMRMIDEIIGEELQYYKGIYRREGLQGVLNLILGPA